jgi:ubiquinone biosynthesis protein
MMPGDRIRLAHKELRRYGQVLAVLARYGFVDILHQMNVRFEGPRHKKIHKPQVRSIDRYTTPQRVRMALEELGPTYVKFGQTLSSRPDLLPMDFIKELSKLQDEVPPFPFHEVKAIIKEQLGHSIGDLYDDFDEKPTAAASLSQVHHARMKTGEEVAVKVQRPGIQETIDADFRILARLATLAERHLPELAVLEPVAFVDEFARTTRNELDFVREGRSADIFREFFEHDDTVHVPKVYWELTASRVLTLEFIHGTKISEFDRLDDLGLDRKTIAMNGANLVLKEIFEVHKFQADPHPGNLFVLENNVIAPVDYGMIGRVDPESVDQLSSLLTAVVDKDAASLASIILQICRAGDPMHIGAIRRELADLLERYYEVPLKQLNMKEITGDVTGFLRRYALHFPQEMGLITKSLITLENLGCGLYPEFNVFELIEPYARDLMIRKSDPVARLRELKKAAYETAMLLDELPSGMREILAKIRHDDIGVKFEHRGLERITSVLDRSSNRLSFAVVIAALIIGSSIVFQTGVGPNVLNYPLPGLAGLITASILGFWLLIGIMRSGRL